MPINIGLADCFSADATSVETADYFVERFTRDRGLRICTQNVRQDHERLKQLAHRASISRTDERQRLKEFDRLLTGSFTQRILRLSDRAQVDWLKACDTLVMAGDEHVDSENDDVAHKTTALDLLGRHPKFIEHMNFQDIPMEQHPELVRSALITALQGQEQLGIFDQYFFQWVAADGSDNQKFLCKKAFEFLEQVWQSDALIDVKTKKIIIYSLLPDHSAKSGDQEGLIASLRGFIAKTDIKIPVECYFWRKNSLKHQERDRFLSVGNWVFEMKHGFDCFGYLSDSVQIDGEPSKFFDNGRIKEKNSFELVGPKRSYSDRAKKLEEVAIPLAL